MAACGHECAPQSLAARVKSLHLQFSLSVSGVEVQKSP